MFKPITFVLLALGLSNPIYATSKLNFDNSKTPPTVAGVPAEEHSNLFDDSSILNLAENFKSETKRKPSSTPGIASSDLMSKAYKDYVNEVTAARTSDEFFNVIDKYDKMYDSIPSTANDLKFSVARMSTWLPLRGIIWRMTTLVHQTLPTQEMFLTSLYNVAEQVKINFNNSHVEAQALFLTMPSKEIIKGEFKTESDFVAFLAKEVYPSIAKAIGRLEKLDMYNESNGKKTPIIFDAKIRFGSNAFGDYADDYNNFDRLKVEGEAERFAAIARLYRRLYNISVMNAYNWNGHLALRREIGKLFGLGVAEATLIDSLPGESTPFIKGVTREKRFETMKKFPNLYRLNSNGKLWMKVAYFNLHKSGLYLSKTWENIKNNDHEYITQLDPEVFLARKEQAEIGIMNIKKLTSVCNAKAGSNVCDQSASGKTSIFGTINKEGVVVDLKGFFDNPPQDLKSLLPVSFAKNEDILKTAAGRIQEVSPRSDVLQMSIEGKKVHFRNYMYGRSKAWSISSDGYGVLFPELKSGADVASAMRILNETRGARIVTNGITMFVR